MDVWYRIFYKVLDMGVAGSIAILAVLVIRALVSKAPKIYSYLLWGIVLFRLLCPVSLPFGLSVMNLAGAAGQKEASAQLGIGTGANGKELLQSQSVETANGKKPIQSGIVETANGKELLQSQSVETANGKGDAQPIGGTQGNGKEPAQSGKTENGKNLAQPEESVKENEKELLHPTEGIGGQGAGVSFAFFLWAAGVGVMACSGLASGLRLRRRAACSMQLKGNVYLADHIASPFVLGLVRPKIYLPAGLGEQEMGYIILHEQRHISRRDYLVKILAFLALCLHWFNPLAWLSFCLAGKDMEMSCDEAVIRSMGDGIRAEYAESLLHFTVGKGKLAGMPLAFGEGDAKSRIKNIMEKKKPAAGGVGIAACLIGAACLATDPKPAETAKGHAEMGNRSLFASALKSSVAGKESKEWLSAAVQEKEEMEEEELAVKWAIRDAIIEQNGTFYSGEYGYDVACCNFVNLKTVSGAPAGGGSQKTTFYGWAYYAEYNFTEHGIEEAGSSHLPAALTFAVDGEEYTLEKYWEPREGSDFAKDVRREFPADIAEDGLDSQKYIVQQVQDCYAQAVEYGRLNTDAILEGLLDTVCSAIPSGSSDPQAYIDAHNTEYREMIYYGDYTVRYFLKRFQQGEGAPAHGTRDGNGQPMQQIEGETGLQGHIMARACEEILGLGKVFPVPASTASTGQEWYSGLKAYGGNILEYYEKMEAENPYTEIGIPIVLPQNRSWIQDIEREVSDKDHLQIKYYDSILEGQCRLWAVKGGQADLQGMIEKSLESKWGKQPAEASLQGIMPKGSPEEIWTGATKSWKSVAVRVQHTEGWVLATWEYGDYVFAALGENGSHTSMIDSLPKAVLGIIAELE